MKGDLFFYSKIRTAAPTKKTTKKSEKEGKSVF
jgi:hypothetical protein